MTTAVRCPECGESKRLKGERKERGAVNITCEACGHRWERDPERCPECGKRPLVPRRIPLLQKARGTQQSIIGYRIGRDCPECGWTSDGPSPTSAV